MIQSLPTVRLCQVYEYRYYRIRCSRIESSAGFSAAGLRDLGLIKWEPCESQAFSGETNANSGEAGLGDGYGFKPYIDIESR